MQSSISQYSSVQSLSRVQLFVTLWTIAHWAPLSMRFPRQESELPFPCLGDLPTQGLIRSSALQADSLPSEPRGKSRWNCFFLLWSSVQFSWVAQSCPTLCDPMNCSTPGLPVHHQLPEFTQTHVHRVSDAIQPSHPLSSPSPPAPNHARIRVFPDESTLHMRWPKYWSFSFSESSTDIYFPAVLLLHLSTLPDCIWTSFL